MDDVSTLLSAAKKWLRITSDKYDDELTQTMQACLTDLRNGGVGEDRIKITDPLIMQAVKLYLKSSFGYGDSDDKFAKAYEFLKYSLALSGDYNVEG